MKHRAIFSICVLIFFLHVWLGWWNCNWTLVNRSGAAIVAVGILLETWKILTTPKADNMPFYQGQEGHSAIRSAVLIICVGTLIQGYADIPFRHASCN